MTTILRSPARWRMLALPVYLPLMVHSAMTSANTPSAAKEAPAPDSIIWVPGKFHAEIEGPATDTHGNIYAVNFAEQGTIGKVSPDGQASLHVKLPKGSIGNGIRFDASGAMYIADYTGHNVLRYADGQLSVYAHEPTMNQPNDLAITRQGILFASDPNWKNHTGQVWRIPAKGQVELVKTGMGTTNGIEVSPDQKHLYVNETKQRRIWRFSLDDEGRASKPELWHQFPDFELDGMRCRPNGDLFVTRYGKGTVAQLNPQGQLVREYRLHSSKPTNVTFSPDYRFLYVTMQVTGHIERINLAD
jgi:sugar lactone lactonase YvrE